MTIGDNPGPQTLVVGVDRSEGSARAVAWVADFARRCGGEVVAVHVLTYDHELLEDLSLDTVRNWRQELTDELRATWTAPLEGVEHQSLVVEAGSTAAGLLEAVADVGADLVVVGAHGRAGLASRMLGGVSYRVTHQSPVPVVVVPPDWTPAPTTA